jgi:hypothetical protein
MIVYPPFDTGAAQEIKTPPLTELIDVVTVAIYEGVVDAVIEVTVENYPQPS